jgi:biopolymer transport protein ExbD
MPLKLQQDDMPSINLTPMIDIVFNLIIFFMVGARFTEMERQVSLNVPKVADTSKLPALPEKCVINVRQDGQIFLNQDVVTVEQLTARLGDARRQQEKLRAIVRADSDGKVQNMAAVLAACRVAGIEDIAISVRQDTKER